MILVRVSRGLSVSDGFYAHVSEDRGRKHLLIDHLHGVAEQAKRFAEDFGASPWAYQAGLWHDLGKYSDKFQERLRNLSNGKLAEHVDHSSKGAQLAMKLVPRGGVIAAYCIAGHHSGLPDGLSSNDACLKERLTKSVPETTNIPPSILVSPPLDARSLPLKNAFQQAFFVRMLYSCLVDADFLDTERFMDSDRHGNRGGYRTLADLKPALDSFLQDKVRNAEKTDVNIIRRDVLEACRAGAASSPGLFSLSVPTGGGKTLSSMAFAMEHAIRNGQSRIIYVIPYTSIIEQTASVFREIFGDEQVLEHHSNYVYSDDPKDDERRIQLSSENWDAPIIVTTNVQFFDSFFANRSSKARKIHNVSGSVVVLDEAQMLPVPVLRPIMEVIRELALNYHSTLLLCTATQPALNTTETFKNGLDNVVELASNPSILDKKLKRVKVKDLGKLADNALAKRLAGRDQVLCIVSTRKHARVLFEKLGQRGGNYHLSALMCPVHRTERLKEIKQRLTDGRTCRVVSTQLVEAGVDVDFPVVFRSIAGLDSLKQAAGRCNREGKLSHGDMFIFEPEEVAPPGFLRQSAEIAREILRKKFKDPLDARAITDYFEHLFWMKGDELDAKGILKMFYADREGYGFSFKEAAEAFRMIEDYFVPIYIPYTNDARGYIGRLRHAEHTGGLLRRLQPYTVQVSSRVADGLLEHGIIEVIDDEHRVLTDLGFKRAYDEHLGLNTNPDGLIKAEDLVA